MGKVYNLTDLPSILSDSMVLFLDPHVSHLRKMGASTQKPGIKLRFRKVDVLQRFRDQFQPYHGLLGCDLESSEAFKGTLIRIPFRTKESAATLTRNEQRLEVQRRFTKDFNIISSYSNTFLHPKYAF